MPGRRDDDVDDFFGKIFTNFMGPSMNDEFRMLTQELEQMFREFGFNNMGMSGGFPPAVPPQNWDRPRPPGNPTSNPRDQMLKNPEEPQEDQDSRSRLEQPQRNDWQSYPPRQPGHSFFGFPFGRRDTETQNYSSPFSEHSFFSSNFQKQITGDGSQWNQKFVQTIRHADGTVEKIEKTTQNGRTCTTTTTTDPHGNTTTNTTCDRPAIESPPLKDNQEPTQPQTPMDNKSDTPTPTSDQSYNKQNSGLLGKFFPFRMFKPKD